MNKRRSLRGEELVNAVIASAQSRKAEKIALVDLAGLSGVADRFLICQCDTAAHTRAVADAIREDLKQKNTPVWLAEGYEEGRWILLDYTDLIVHILLPELREYYQLERLWDGAKVTPVESDGEESDGGSDSGF